MVPRKSGGVLMDLFDILQRFLDPEFQGEFRRRLAVITEGIELSGGEQGLEQLNRTERAKARLAERQARQRAKQVLEP
jgi:hypothetical protein